MKKNYCFLVAVLVLFVMNLQAQTARSLYFIDNAPARLQLNPALQPMRGYINVPVIGGFGASVVSDPLSVEDFMDILDQENEFLQNDKLFTRLKNKNNLNLFLNTDLLSLGFYSGKGFWTINAGTKVFVNASIPKTLFEFARNSNDLSSIIDEFLSNRNEASFQQALKQLGTSYKISDFMLSANVFAEIGVGYSRPVSDRLTLGGRMKVLVGVGNVDAHIEEININLDYPQNIQNVDDFTWRVSSRGSMEVSMKGLELSKNEEEGYIDDLDFDSPGVGGFGASVDLGLTYKLLNNLTISAGIIDCGFINWSKSATTLTKVKSNHEYNAGEEGTNIIDYDLIKLVPEDTEEGRTTSLEPTLNLGAEYTLLNKKFGIGVLYTNRFQKTESFSELTLSANYHPVNWFSTTVSYSFLNSKGKTFGLGVKLGPIFLASDYLITGDFESINRANAYLGISLGLGKKRDK
jgi:hypothetical protein